MASLPDQLQAAVEKTEQLTMQFNGMTQGDENTEVMTDNGLVPSVLKVYKEIRDKFDADAVLSQSLAARDEAVGARDEAVPAATTATTQAGIATTAAGTATTQAGIATTAATTATTQAGIATTQAGDATTQAGIATTQAGDATTQAGIATTQAGIATTQAGIATTQAGNAAASENAAASYAAAINPFNLSRVNGVHFDGVTSGATTPADLRILNTVLTCVLAFEIKTNPPPGTYVVVKGDQSGGWGLIRHSGGSIAINSRQAGSASIFSQAIDVIPAANVVGKHLLILELSVMGNVPLTRVFEAGAWRTIPQSVSGGTYGDATVDASFGFRVYGGGNRMPGLIMYGAQFYNRSLTVAECNEIVASSGQVAPLSARAALLAHHPFDDKFGYVLRDISHVGAHGLLLESGCTALIPDNSGELSVLAMAVPAAPTNASYVLRAGSIVPPQTYVTALTIDGVPVDLLGVANQPLNLQRLRLVRGTGSTVIVQRSDGTTHTAITGEVPVADFDSVSFYAKLSTN